MVYEKDLIENIDEAIKKSDIIVDPKLNIRPAKYLRQVYLLLNIWKIPVGELSSGIELLLDNKNVTKHLFLTIVPRIKDENKKKLVVEYLELSPLLLDKTH